MDYYPSSPSGMEDENERYSQYTAREIAGYKMALENHAELVNVGQVYDKNLNDLHNTTQRFERLGERGREANVWIEAAMRRIKTLLNNNLEKATPPASRSLTELQMEATQYPDRSRKRGELGDQLGREMVTKMRAVLERGDVSAERKHRIEAAIAEYEELDMRKQGLNNAHLVYAEWQ
ncbi:hypothetical protein EVG20_g7604 [Dentipellis fragilis]|uniref:Uncharacterized protein n=1 Tax=Dentipellis fragilis TaxID=205917 RepID=A0A4Y9YGB6_9AGAM|nr:hypothetical protein EVG20_g7604 [Dentipellis fragilis]